jgi:signal transduction histidine kinase
VVGLLLCAVYAAVPTHFVVFRELVLYTVTEVGAVLAIVAGVALYRPVAPKAWLLIAAGLASISIGDLLFGVYEVIDRNPFPSPADAFYLAGYPCLAAGLVVAIRCQGRTEDRRALIDSAIIAVSAGLLAWAYIIQPAVSSDLTPFAAAVTSAYPIADIGVLAITLRFVMGSHWDAPALRLLVLGLFLTFVGDFVYQGDVLGGAGSNTVFVNTTLLLGVVVMGLAGLHRSMTALTAPTEGPGERAERPDALRFVLLAGACMVPPVVLAVQAIRGEKLFVPAVVTATVVLVALVGARFADITGRAYRSADREAVLSRYASALLAAEGEEELFAVARQAAIAVVGGRGVDIVRIGSGTGRAGDVVVAPVEVRGEVVAELVADADHAGLSRSRHSLATVATELALALEREGLLATERAAAAALAERNERLRELDRMKDQFVSTVSHELRTPLTSMIGYLEIVLEGEAGELNPEQKRFLEVVNRNSDRLNQLIDDILFVARVDAGKFSIEKEWTDLSKLAREAGESARGAAGRTGLDVRVSAHDELRVWADPVRLGQLLDNLLSNAVKFTPEGGVVSLDVAARGDNVRVEVSDTGVGIPEDEMTRLFERFFRASTGTAARGTGLGLQIVKTIAEAHGGTVSVASRVGQGTTFTIDLPMRSDGAEAAAR